MFWHGCILWTCLLECWTPEFHSCKMVFSLQCWKFSYNMLSIYANNLSCFTLVTWPQSYLLVPDDLQGVQQMKHVCFSFFLFWFTNCRILTSLHPHGWEPIWFLMILFKKLYGSCSYLRTLGWHPPKLVAFELVSSLVMAFIGWQLFSACQRPWKLFS